MHLYLCRQLLKMTKILLTLLSCFCLATAGNAQTIKIKCNSAENLHLVLIGSDAQGHKTTRTLYDVTVGFKKRISLFKEKYGYDNYDNSSMQHENGDSTNRWRELHIYNNSNTLFSRLDLTKPVDRIDVPESGIWLRVKQHTERDYVLTDVTINDSK